MSSTHSVIVIGSGLAALCAAIEASDAGAQVTVIEKDKRGGGNSTKASSGISCSESHYQAEQDIKDTNEAYNTDLIKSGQGKSLPDIVDIATANSSSAIDFLDKHGLILGTVLQCGGHSYPRTHRFIKDAQGKAPPVGWTLVSTLRKVVEGKSNCKVICNSRVTELLQDDKKQVIGCEYEDCDSHEKTVLKANAVVLASGGYANDHTETSLLKEFVPHIADLPTTNGPFATGDGVKLARKIDAQLTLMDQVQLHPTGFVDPNDLNNTTKFLAPEALRGVGGILVNTKGERFVNELDRRDNVTKGIQGNCSPISVGDNTTKYSASYIILSDEMVDTLGRGDVNFYMSKSLINKVDNLNQFSEKTGVNIDAITNTIKSYIKACETKDDKFGKTVFPNTFNLEGPFYYGIITPSLHYTMGGVKINTNCQVLNTKDEPIIGLYGAGEVTGGLHGANRLAGASLMECVVFGRIAGVEAAKL